MFCVARVRPGAELERAVYKRTCYFENVQTCSNEKKWGQLKDGLGVIKVICRVDVWGGVGVLIGVISP